METIAYLEEEDFEQNGDIKSYVNKGKPIILMAQGNFCGFCTMAKPDFVKFSKSNNNVICCTITIDGELSERNASKFLKKWDPENYKGVPYYCGFDSNGKFIRTHLGGRSYEDLVTFSLSLK